MKTSKTLKIPKKFNGVPRSKWPKRPCEVCGRKFFLLRKGRITCGSRCREMKWRKEHPEAMAAAKRRERLKARGITPERYEELMALQGGKCALCDREVDTGQRRLAVDHDHRTGKVRGLLCMAHNTMLGKAGDDPRLLRLAAKYVERGGVI